MKIKVEIEIKDEYNHEGKILVPTGEYRNARSKEYFLNNGAIRVCNHAKGTIDKYPILSKRRWRAVLGQCYYGCGDLAIECVCEEYAKYNDEDYTSGNYYQTEALARISFNKIKPIHLGAVHG